MNATVEEIEGYDKEDSNWDYPIDTVLIRNETRTVFDVLRRIEKGSYVMNPDFQRDFIWSEEKQSKLIESVLMLIPLPVFYLAENKMEQMVVVDGLQRLSTFQRFVANKFKLKLPNQIDLNKKTFNDLTPKLQNRIEDCNLILYVIDSKVPNKALLDIFERVNSGVPLTRQQMRNCLYMGAATRFLKDESNSELFLDATGRSLDPKTMKDREIVNRFCAFYIFGVGEYRGGMDDFLVRSLEKMNTFKQDEFEKISADLRTSLRNNVIAFQEHAFRKNVLEQKNRSPFNVSLWDVMSIGLLRYSEHEIEKQKSKLRDGFHNLMKDPEFMDSITLGTNNVKRVRTRFEKFESMLKEVFG
ncbi:MAG: DUF262 domain-containing protein [Magnetococcales bacterium]|nr:DUF262 domain-containing protein [Magnetococcales bacterium]